MIRVNKLPWLMPDVPRPDIAGQLGGLEGAKKYRSWTDGVASIPKARTARRAEYDEHFRAAVEERFGGPRFRLTPIQVDARKLAMPDVVANRARYEMYVRMLDSGDRLPPLVVEDLGAPGERLLLVVDGVHRVQAALDTKNYKLRVLLREPVSP